MRTRWLIPAALLLLCGSTACNLEPFFYYFRKLEITPDGHFVRLQRLPSQPLTGSYYSITRGGNIDIINHYDSPSGQPSHIVLSLGSDNDRRLHNTTRLEPVAAGPYGTIELEKECIFKPLSSGYRSSVGVRVYLNDTPPPPSVALPRLPPGNGSQLTGVTLIRTMQTPSGYFVVAATYEASGRLGSVLQSTVKPGGELIPRQTTSSIGSMWQGRSRELGILPEFHAADYLKSHRVLLPPAPKPMIDTIVVLRYGFDTYLQVDRISNETRVSSSYFQPYVSPEDSSLNDTCDAYLKNQLVSGESTSY